MPSLSSSLLEVVPYTYIDQLGRSAVSKNRLSRRSFLKTASAAVATAPAVASSSKSANDRIRVAVVGLSGRGRSLIDAFHDLGKDNVEIVTFCDCDDNVMAERAGDSTKK